VLGFEVLDGQRRVKRRGEAVLGGLPKGSGCEIVLDGLDVLLLEVRLPRLSGARLAAALPGLVEERVTGDIERCHVVAAGFGPDGQGTAAVVDRALLRRGLDILQRAGQRVVHATPQPLALFAGQGVWRVRVADGHGSVRTGALTGAAFSAGSPPLELKLLLAQSTTRPRAIEVEGDCDTTAWSEALGVAVQAAAPAAVAAPVLLDLMQYEFGGSVLPWEAWRGTAVLATLVLVTALGGLNLHAWLLRHQEQTLRAAMVRVVKDVDPQVPIVLDPLAQMRRHVSDLRAGAGTESEGFLALAAAFGRLASADAVQSLQYRDGQLSVRLRGAADGNDAQRKMLIERAAAAGLMVSATGDTLQVSRGRAK
jgi:general secretion pathway protein L